MAPGAARTPSALTGALWVASLALRENSPQAVVSFQNCTVLKKTSTLNYVEKKN